jgi:hypothetical protein
MHEYDGNPSGSELGESAQGPADFPPVVGPRPERQRAREVVHDDNGDPDIVS